MSAAGRHCMSAHAHAPPRPAPPPPPSRAELAANLQAAGLDLASAPAEVFPFLAAHPHVLTRGGAAELGALLRLAGSWGLPPALRPLLPARCPALLGSDPEEAQVGRRAGWVGEGGGRAPH